MRRRTPLAVAVCSVAMVTGAPTAASAAGLAAASLPTYWQAQGCKHGHPSKVAYRTITQITRSTKPLNKRRVKRARHYVRCVATVKKSRAVRRHWKRQLAIRRTKRWYYIYARMPWGDKVWARNTGGCEGGNDPTKHNPSGLYHGTFQFLLSTWWAAGGTGDPHTKTWHEQAVIAIRLKWREGAGHWPVCG